MSDKLKKIFNLRQTQINSLHEIFEIAVRAETDPNLFSLLEVSMNEIDQIKQDFFSYHNSIIGVADVTEGVTFEEQDALRKKFNDEFLRIKQIFHDLKCKQRKSETKDDEVCNLQLKQIELKSFSGDITEFPTWIDMYDAVIHKNKKLSSIEKFNYLLNSLKGPAFSLIQTLPMTSSNYEIAYDTLVERYKNTRHLAVAYWSKIENSHKMSSDDPRELRALLDNFEENKRALIKICGTLLQCRC